MTSFNSCIIPLHSGFCFSPLSLSLSLSLFFIYTLGFLSRIFSKKSYKYEPQILKEHRLKYISPGFILQDNDIHHLQTSLTKYGTNTFRTKCGKEFIL
jgi:hypothetical protein